MSVLGSARLTRMQCRAAHDAFAKLQRERARGASDAANQTELVSSLRREVDQLTKRLTVSMVFVL